MGSQPAKKAPELRAQGQGEGKGAAALVPHSLHPSPGPNPDLGPRDTSCPLPSTPVVRPHGCCYLSSGRLRGLGSEWGVSRFLRTLNRGSHLHPIHTILFFFGETACQFTFSHAQVLLFTWSGPCLGFQSSWGCVSNTVLSHAVVSGMTSPAPSGCAGSRHLV